jgi:serine protease
MEYRQFCRRAMRGLAAAVVIFIVGQALTPTYAQTETTSAAALGEVNSKSKEPTRVHVPGSQPAIITGPLINNGGPVQTSPIIYVVYWGWTSDPSGEQTYLANFLSTVGGTPWLNTVTQYSSAGNPTHLYGGSWSDPTSVPTQPTDAQIQSEALSAASHFGVGTSVNVQIVVATPTGHSSAGFGSTYCAYHGKIAADPNVTYTNLPYMTDAGSTCGANTVSGPLDGVSIVEGHELAESITDPLLNAWLDAGNNEIGDKCAWTDLSVIATSLGNFAVQPLWSNAANGCVLSTTVPFPPPASISADVVFACPLTLVSWSSVSGATSYQLYAEQGNPPWFGSGGLQFTGPDTQKKIRTGNHLNYMWKVEACNASGCSALSTATASGASPAPCP